MNRILLTLAVLALPCYALSAPSDSTSSVRANSLRNDAWALQFSFDSGFSGGEVALKFHLSPKNALRAGLSLFGRSSDEEGTYSEGDFLSESDEAQFGVEFLFLRYPRPLASTNFYFGAGPFVDFSERTSSSYNPEYQELGEDKLTEVGVVAVIGAEWFASQGLSLHIEYKMSAGHSWGERTYRYRSSFLPAELRESDLDRWQVEAGRRVFLGLGMYF